MVGSGLTNKYLATVEVVNTLVYYDSATITTVKSFIVQAHDNTERIYVMTHQSLRNE